MVFISEFSIDYTKGPEDFLLASQIYPKLLGKMFYEFVENQKSYKIAKLPMVPQVSSI